MDAASLLGAANVVIANPTGGLTHKETPMSESASAAVPIKQKGEGVVSYGKRAAIPALKTFGKATVGYAGAGVIGHLVHNRFGRSVGQVLVAGIFGMLRQPEMATGAGLQAIRSLLAGFFGEGITTSGILADDPDMVLEGLGDDFDELALDVDDLDDDLMGLGEEFDLDDLDAMANYYGYDELDGLGEDDTHVLSSGDDQFGLSF